MTHAIVKGAKWDVRVTPDLTDNFAVELFPTPPEGTQKTTELYKPWPVPLVLKLLANSERDALVCALEHLKKLGKIDSFELDPVTSSPPSPDQPARPS